MRKARIILFDR